MAEPQSIPCPICGEDILEGLDACPNCGAAVDAAALRDLMKALGVGSEKAHELFRAGYRSPGDLGGKSVDEALKTRESGVLYLCPECGAFVSSADKVCAKCGAELAEEAMDLEKFLEGGGTKECPACGETIPAEALVCPACKVEIAVEAAGPEPTTFLCANCGATVLESQQTCDTCGQPVRGIAASPSAAPSEAAPVPEATTADQELREIEQLLEEAQPQAEAEAIAEELGKLAAEVEAEEAVAELEGPPPRSVRPAADLPITRFVAPGPPRRSRTDRLREGLLFATLGALLPAAYAALVPSEIGGWAVLAITGSIFASALALAFLDLAPFRRQRRAFALAFAGGLAVLAVPLLAAAGAALPVVGGGILLAAGAALMVGSAYPFRLSAATFAPWFGALPGMLTVATVLAVHAPSGSPALSMATEAVLALAVATSALVLLRARWVDARVAKTVRRAEGLAMQRDYKAAITELDRAIQLTGEQGSEAAWYSKGAALVVLGRYEEAMACIDTALRINPRNEVAWVNKGNALVRMGRLVDALKCYNSAIKVNPQYEVAWNNKGNALARMGKFEDALKCYERALALDRTYRGAWVNKGYVLTKIGDFEGAARCADEALKLGGPGGVAA